MGNEDTISILNKVCSRRENKFISTVKELNTNKLLYLMAVPGILFLLIFNYLPMFGIVISFKNYRFDKGIFGSDWASPIYDNFSYFFSSEYAWRVTRNTLLLNFMFIVVGIICMVALSLMINEIINNHYKKLTQIIIFFPFFISWIVVSAFTYNLFNYENGSLNRLLNAVGMKGINWYGKPNLWPLILLMFYLWKGVGYGCVLYLATLNGIDKTLYEAAEIDGAKKIHQIRYISIPMLIPTIITLTLLSLGKIMNADFGMFYSLVGDNALLYPTTDVIDTFIYRCLRRNGDIAMSSAAGFYQSIISFILFFIANKMVKSYNPEMGLF